MKSDTSLTSDVMPKQKLLQRINELEKKVAFLEGKLTTFAAADVEGGDDFCELGDDEGSFMVPQCVDESLEVFSSAIKSRATWLVALLSLQSMSSLILRDNESMLQSHPTIIFYLTMLVGAGGNAGSQSAVRIIRGIATVAITNGTRKNYLLRELKMAAILASALTAVGFARVNLFGAGTMEETLAITASLFVVTFTSVVFGAALPLIIEKTGQDPAHAGSAIQVAMDILGVFIVCTISSIFL